MSYNADMLRARLENTNESTDSITSTALWILFHKRHAPEIAQEWAQCLETLSDKLSAVYIANEVIQQSKFKRKGEFVSAFAPVLPKALSGVYSTSNLATRDRIVRVIKVWRDRNIFSAEDQQNIETALAKGVEVPSELMPLVRVFSEFQSDPKKDLYERVEAELASVAKAAENLMATRAQRYTAADAIASSHNSVGANNDEFDDGDVGYAE